MSEGGIRFDKNPGPKELGKTIARNTPKSTGEISRVSFLKMGLASLAALATTRILNKHSVTVGLSEKTRSTTDPENLAGKTISYTEGEFELSTDPNKLVARDRDGNTFNLQKDVDTINGVKLQAILATSDKFRVTNPVTEIQQTSSQQGTSDGTRKFIFTALVIDDPIGNLAEKELLIEYSQNTTSTEGVTYLGDKAFETRNATIKKFTSKGIAETTDNKLLPIGAISLSKATK